MFLQRREQAFQHSCEATGATSPVIEAEGVLHKLIEQESERHDILTINKDTDFHVDFDPSTADAAQRLLRDNSRPSSSPPSRHPARARSSPPTMAVSGLRRRCTC